MGGTEAENSAIGVVKGSNFRSETHVSFWLINIIALYLILRLNYLLKSKQRPIALDSLVG